MVVGTRSQFDVLWDWKKVGFDQMSGMDVYNFLHMVISIGRTNSNTACLRKKVDDLMRVDEMTNHHLREEVDDLMGADEVTYY